MSTTTGAALAWLRANKPNRISLTSGGYPMWHAPTLSRVTGTLLILAGLHDQGMRRAQVADVATYSPMSTSAVRTRLEWLATVYGVVRRAKVDRLVWYWIDDDALAEGTKVPGRPGGAA